MRLTRRSYGLLMALPCVAILVFLFIGPLVYAFVLSFHEWFASATAAWEFNSGLNYYYVLTDHEFYLSLYNTLIIGGLSLAIEFSLGLALALILTREMRGRSLLVAVFSSPMMMIPVMVGHLWRIMYFRDIGPLDAITKMFLGYSVPWLGDTLYSKLALVFANAWEWTPFMMLILLAGFTAIPISLYEAAQIDGASAWQTFRRVTIPMARPLIVLALLIRGMEQVKLFDVVYLITNGGPANDTETITLYLFRRAFEFFDMGKATAASFILLIIVTVIVAVFIRYAYREA